MATLGVHTALLEQQAAQIDSRTPGSLSSLQLQVIGSLTGSVETVDVGTPYGPLHVTVQGDKNKPPIVTCHDLGFNYSSSFSTFLTNPVMSSLSGAFCWYHIDLPGQEPYANKLPEDYVFPSMTQLSEQVEYMADHFQLPSIIGLGVGSGGDILARYAILCPHRVRGLVLVNTCLQSSDWASFDWILSKIAVWQLQGRKEGFPQFSLSNILRHSIGPQALGREAVSVFKESLAVAQNPHNLALLLQSYLSRSTIGSEFARAARCKCLFITSGNYRHSREVVSLIAEMPVNKATLLEVPDTSGLLLCEKPETIATALCYFLQGLGLIPTHSSPLSHPPPSCDPPVLSLHGHSVPLHTAV